MPNWQCYNTIIGNGQALGTIFSVEYEVRIIFALGSWYIG